MYEAAPGFAAGHVAGRGGGSSRHPLPAGRRPEPLALNTQPIAPGLRCPSAPAYPGLADRSSPAETLRPPNRIEAGRAGQAEERALEAPAGSPESIRDRAAQARPEPASRNSVAPIFTIPAAHPGDDDPFAELCRPLPSRYRGRPDTKPGRLPRPPSVADNRPPPTKDELLQDIKAEAAEKRQELDQLRDMKDRARDELAAEAQDRTEDERVVFRRELDEILEIQEPDRRPGDQRSLRQVRPQLRPRAPGEGLPALMLANGRMTTEAKLNLLRHYGVPEPGVLDYIANEIAHRQMNSRNGPRTPGPGPRRRGPTTAPEQAAEELPRSRPAGRRIQPRRRGREPPGTLSHPRT